MNAPARSFVVQAPAAVPVPLLIGLMGGPGAGKTYSALTLAQGMRCPDRGKPVLIDTEAGRSQKYRDVFDFDWIDFKPPFRPADFLAAVMAALERKPCAIIVDSMSDEHDGIGGVLDWHETELDRMAGEDWAKRERMTQAAWIKPKAARRLMINGLLQVTTPMIFCFRAREKTKPLKDDRGKTVPTNIGWQPIAPAEIVHAMDINCLLPLRSDGVPAWKGDKVGEDFVIKLPRQFRGMFEDGAPITPEIGRALAEWARGGPPPPGAGRAPVGAAAPAGATVDDLIAEGDSRAAMGTEALQQWWTEVLTAAERKAVGAHLQGWKDAAAAATKAAGTFPGDTP